MRRTLLLSVLLVLAAAGCSNDSNPDNDAASASLPSATTATSPTPSAAASYVDAVNALCEAMIPPVMAVRGDSDADGGGDIPTLAEYAEQDAELRPIIEKFDDDVAALPVSDADRAAADAFEAYREFLDADNEKILAAAEDGDQAAYGSAMAMSAEFEAKRSALNQVGIECPAR